MISHAEAGGQRAGGSFARVRGACDGECRMRRSFSGAAGVTIAGGAGEGWLIIVGGDRGGEDAAGGGRESDALGAGVA